LIGSRFGKRVLLPRLSPNKTLEGFLGGTMVGILGGFLLGWLLKEQLPYLTPWKGALLGGIMGPVAFIGDAMMSLIKRTLKVKDTGKLLPGHGGVLDRLDSMLWAFVAASIFRLFL
jgi:phosphatidate cytidylyltransferase